MHRLQDLVRLHRMENRARTVARLLKMSPNTERKYCLALEAEGEVPMVDGLGKPAWQEAARGW